MATKKRVFISFDYDNDEGAKIMLAGQAKLPDSPFDFKDASVKEHLTGDWKEKIKRRMDKVDTPSPMNSMQHLSVQVVLGLALTISAHVAQAQSVWKLDTRGAKGPIAQVTLADSGAKRRSSFVAFEYARKCDPIFSVAEITGSRLGTAVSQSVLSGTKIGVVVNGKFHTWNAAMTKYDNGYEAGFGVTNELFGVLTGKVDSLVYVTPDGERVPLPVGGFRQAVQSAFDACAKRFK